MFRFPQEDRRCHMILRSLFLSLSQEMLHVRKQKVYVRNGISADRLFHIEQFLLYTSLKKHVKYYATCSDKHLKIYLHYIKVVCYSMCNSAV